MATTVNGVDCAIELKGTGLPACVQELGNPVGFFKTSINWSFDPETETFNLSYIQTQIQNGNFVPFLESFNFTDNSEETVFQTSQSGNESKVRSGKAKVQFDFQKGLCWHTSAYTHNKSQLSIIYIWSNGVFGVNYNETTGLVKGQRANYLDVGTFTNNDGTNQFTTPIMIQFRNTDEYNANMATIKATDFTLDDIKGAIDVTIKVPTPPVDNQNTIQFTAFAGCNSTYSIGVLASDDIAITGKTVSTLVFDPQTELYTATISETFDSGDIYTVSINDGTYDSAIVENQIYKGKSASLTVA
jgi:hypothetical protein